MCCDLYLFLECSFDLFGVFCWVLVNPLQILLACGHAGRPPLLPLQAVPLPLGLPVVVGAHLESLGQLGDS